MKGLLVAVLVILACGFVRAQMSAWEPSAGHVQVPIWPGPVPNARHGMGPEFSDWDTKDLVAGRPWLAVERVSRPTMTVYSPDFDKAGMKNTGAAVVVFPGGGYQVLAIDLEGTEVCDWLTAKGITCVLLKYRVPGSGVLPKSGPYPDSPEALEDAQRTLGLVRLHAAELHIDPHKVGVLGFSAGGSLVAETSNEFARRVYPAMDAADKESCRPDFAVAIYPGHLTLETAEHDARRAGRKLMVPRGSVGSGPEGAFAFNPEIHVTKQTPTTFLLQNEDDEVDGVEQALSYYAALLRAGVPVEMHLYAQGGHAFGLRRTKLPATAWPDLVETWLHTIGVLGSR